jgi:hypothetical protein
MPKSHSIISALVTSSADDPRLSSRRIDQSVTDQLRQECTSIIDSVNWRTKMAKRLQVPGSVRGTVSVTIDRRTRNVTLPFYIGRLMPEHAQASILDHVHMSGARGSRCHAMITKVADELIVVDPGSLSGIRTRKRSEFPHMVHSLPWTRNVLKFGHQERFVLSLDGILVGFNLDLNLPGLEATECTVCMMAPAIERLQRCGHCVACSSCLDQLTLCPICRNRIGEHRQVTVAPHLMYR